jgi:RCC1 and BTB domain-containing protein
MEVNEITNEATLTLINNMRKLINNETYSDVVFVLEGKKIFAHRAILLAQCEHFRAMFSNGMKEST